MKREKICYIGKNNKYKTSTLLEINKKNTETNIFSLFLNNEENITTNQIVEGDQSEFREATKLKSEELNLYSTKNNNRTNVNNADYIFKYILKNYSDKYIELIKKFKTSEGKFLDEFISKSSESVIKSECSSGINCLLVICSYIIFIKEYTNFNTILIDEIERHLDAENAYNITRFLTKELENYNINITTHSENVISALDGFVIKSLNSHREYNSNDYIDVSIIRNKFFYVEEISAIISEKEFIYECIYKVENGENLEYRDISKLREIKENATKLTSNDIDNLNLLLGDNW